MSKGSFEKIIAVFFLCELLTLLIFGNAFLMASFICASHIEHIIPSIFTVVLTAVFPLLDLAGAVLDTPEQPEHPAQPPEQHEQPLPVISALSPEITLLPQKNTITSNINITTAFPKTASIHNHPAVSNPCKSPQTNTMSAGNYYLLQ